MMSDRLEMLDGANGAGQRRMFDSLKTKVAMRKPSIQESQRFRAADNYLRCDSSGNCMMDDQLTGSNPRTWSPTD